jgi:hypothetical protein
LEEVGLFPIDHYIGVWRQTIALFIVHRPIFDFCVNGKRRCGSSPRLFWWEQPMHLDLAREGEAEGSEIGLEEEDDGLGLDN